MLNLVELPILGLLKEGPLHGYELKQRLENLVGYFGTLSYGSLYPMLSKLELRGQVSKSGEEYTVRIVYRITPKGKERLASLMHDSAVPLTLKMLFFEAISPQDRSKILESQKKEWVRKLAKYRLVQEHIDVRYTSCYQVALLAREIEHLEKDITWLERLLDEEG